MKTELLEKILLKLLDSDAWNANMSDELEAPYKIWDFIIIRSYYAGVLYGKYMWRTENWILLHQSRRLYYRNCKQWISLSELSIHWIKSDSKVTEPVDIELTDPTVSEILIPTKECKESIDKQPNYKA